MTTRRCVQLLALAILAVSASAHGADARPLDRRGLVATFHDEFETLNVADPRDRQTWRGHNWKTWYANGSDPFMLDNRSLPANGESQAYIDSAWPERTPDIAWPDAVSAHNGVLRLRADPVPVALRPQVHGLRYTSGMIASWGMFSQRYGVFEARMRLPKGRGMWPAFWTLNETGGWPPEIDIMEFLGHDTRTTWSVAHSRRNGTHVARSREIPHTVDMTRDFHIFAVDWRPATLTYYIDNEAVLQVPTPHDMHSPMFLVLNLAVGGRWGGLPDAATVFPGYYEVDWVRVWQRPSNTARPAVARAPSTRPVARAATTIPVARAATTIPVARAATTIPVARATTPATSAARAATPVRPTASATTPARSATPVVRSPIGSPKAGPKQALKK